MEFALDVGMVAGTHCGIELQRPLRQEVEDRGRVGRHAHFEVRQRIGFGRGQTADIGQAIAEAVINASHPVDVAHAVLVADEIRALLRNVRHCGVVQLGIRPAVDDDAKPGRAADANHVLRDAGGIAFGQIRRKQQDAVGTVGLRRLGMLDRLSRAATGRRDDWHLARHLLDGGLDHTVEFRGRQRKELARATGSEQPRDGVSRQPFKVVSIGSLVEGIILVEMGNGEGQQPSAQCVAQFLGRVFAHQFDFSICDD